jgi:glycosyltransferase involved in cell wall biosynthesis
MSRRLTFAISADYARRTGGWIYDQRLLEGLAALGWTLEHLTLPAGFPDPDAAARAQMAAQIGALPARTILLQDQLTFSVAPDLAAAQRGRLRQVVIVHHPLGLEGDRPAAAARDLLATERQALACADLVIATSCATAELLARDLDLAPARVVVAPPGTDPRPLSPGGAGPRLRLLSVGAVVPRKDHGLLLEALGGLVDRAWLLDLVGNLDRAPAHVAALRARLAELRLTERVTLHGELCDAGLERLWRDADLYVASARHEGYGMAVAEAVARGLPVVTTDAGAVGGWLDRAAALVVPSADGEALRAALRLVLDDPARRAAMRHGALAARAGLPRWTATAAAVNTRLSLLLDGGANG